MLYSKETPEKLMDEAGITWDDYFDRQSGSSKKKISIVFFGVLLIFISIVFGWMYLYPLDRQTEYLMVVNDVENGNYLKIGSYERFVKNEAAKKQAEEQSLLDEINQVNAQVDNDQEK